MDVEELRHQIYQFNDEELFYKEQYEAREAGQILCLYRKTGYSGGDPPPLTDSGSERNHSTGI